MQSSSWSIYHPEGRFRILATKRLVGDAWLPILTNANCRVEIFEGETPFGEEELISAIGNTCHGALSQLNEPWTARVLERFAAAKGRVVSSYAVGVNNIDISAASRFHIAVCNTPGVLTEATGELALALVFAAIRRIPESDRFMREHRFTGWLPHLMLGRQLTGRTLALFGAGRIGQFIARALCGGFGMNVLYWNPHARPQLEEYVHDVAQLTSRHHLPQPWIRRTENIDELFKEGDVIVLASLYHSDLHHLVNAQRFALCKESAVLVNISRGPIVDESALVAHLRAHPDFRAGLDVYEFEPKLVDGLTDLPNVVLSPHTGSATLEARSAMAVLATYNCVGVLLEYPANHSHPVSAWQKDSPPRLVPSLINATELGWKKEIEYQEL